MGKPSIFIASSSRTATLAEVLRDQLITGDFANATLRNEERNRRLGATTIQMLEGAAAKYDFAVVILARDDVLIKETGDALKARDDCVFEAGLFINALGRERCFLINSVEQRELPSDLAGVISLPFKEPETTKLSDRDACTEAIRSVTAALKDSVQRAGRMRNRELSADELLERERLQSGDGGGDLDEDQVVVASIQPLELGYGPALQVRKNIEAGVYYVYFFKGDRDGAGKICKLLQAILLAPILDRQEGNSFLNRQRRMADPDTQSKIVEDLSQICARDSLKIFFLPTAPGLQYCIHNAASALKAILYLKRADGFIKWEEGRNAHEFWAEERLKQGIESAPPCVVFHGASGFDVKKDPFCNQLKMEVERFFPGISEKVVRLCFDGKLG
jgi:hypothetical protein